MRYEPWPLALVPQLLLQLPAARRLIVLSLDLSIQLLLRCCPAASNSAVFRACVHLQKDGEHQGQLLREAEQAPLAADKARAFHVTAVAEPGTDLLPLSAASASSVFLRTV